MSFLNSLSSAPPQPQYQNVLDAAVIATESKPTFVDKNIMAQDQMIIDALNKGGYAEIMAPTQDELTYVNSVFQSKGFINIDSVTYETVQQIGKTELEELNKAIKQFTTQMNGVRTTGIFDLIDDLSKEVDPSELEAIWNKACNAQPTLLAKFLNLFVKGAATKSVKHRLEDLALLMQSRGTSLELKISQIEKGLTDQRSSQEKNIKMLNDSYDIYYRAFVQLRKQFALIIYLEHTYKDQFERFKESIGTSQDFAINRKLQEYTRTFDDIQNKRLLLHKSLLQLDITAKQGDNLINVCTNLLKEINNTLLASMPMIRSNLTSIVIAIEAHKAMLGNNSARTLEQQSGLLAAKTIGDLSVKSTLLAGESRLQDAQCMDELVKTMASFKSQMVAAKDKSEQNIQQATAILQNATEEAMKIMS